MLKDKFLTIKSHSSGELKVLGSRFIGNAFPVSNKNEAENHILDIEKEFHDATHNPFAYKVLRDGKPIIRISDDKEPQGTAGKPIFSAIEKYDLSNILIVITRYFGGKKLGKGGLARAYRNCAEITIENARKVQCLLYKTVTINFPYDKIGLIVKIINDVNGKIINQSSMEKYSFTVDIPLNNVNVFNEKIGLIAIKDEISIIN